MIRPAVKRGRRVEVVKIVLRVAWVGGRALERDVVGAVNIGLKYLNPDESPIGVGKADDPTPRCNPSNGNKNIHKHHQALLEGTLSTTIEIRFCKNHAKTRE